MHTFVRGTKKQGVPASRASQARADDATHERDLFVVASKDPLQEGTPARAVTGGRDSLDLRHAVILTVRTECPGREVTGAVGGIEEPRIGIPLAGHRGMSAVGPRTVDR